MKFKIIITIYTFLLIICASISSLLADSHVNNCTITNGVFSAAEVIGDGGGEYCASAPETYEIVAYEMYLCTAAPTAPTLSSSMGLENCFKNWESTTGATLPLQQNQTRDMPGTMSRPPNGTYTHGVMLIDNTFGVTMAMQFDGAVGGQDGTSGVFCASVAGSETYGSGGNIPSASSTCGSSAITPGKFVETLTSFDSGGFVAAVSADNLNGTSASISGFLVDTDGNLAVNDADVDKLIGSLVFADAVNFTEATTTLTMLFNVGEGMSIYDDGSDQITFGSGPFQAILTTD